MANANIPEIANVIPGSRPAALMPAVKNPTLVYNQTRGMGRGQFWQPEYNLAEIGRIEDTDSYVRQAFSKKVALMFKEGWDLVGKNPKTVRYIRIRFDQMARATGKATLELLRDIGSGLIRKSNVFLVKVRDVDASGGKLRTDSTTDSELKPIAGYFLAPAETMEYALNGNKIIQWRQNMPNGDIKEYQPINVVHMYYDRKEGFIFGTPFLTPVIDDIRALRKIEENIELLVYQHLFPLFQWVVGTKEAPAGFDELGNREVDLVKAEVQFMPTEGGIVTTERNEIRAIGAEGRALRAEGYIAHFKARVFAGLGVSSVDMGDGQTANRSTADNMSRNLIDSVKDFQLVMETFVNECLINELLLESTFGDTVLDPENRVTIKFREIDIDAQIKKEAHMADQFNKNLVTHDEARLRIGLEPVQMPTQDEAETGEDLTLKFPAFHKLFWKMIDEPKALIQAIDEPYSAAAKAAAKNPSTGINTPDNKAATDEALKHEKNLEKIKGDAKVAAAKATAKARPKPKVRDAALSSTYNELQLGMARYVTETDEIDYDWLDKIVRASMENSIPKLHSQSILAFRDGYGRFGSVGSNAFIRSIKHAREVTSKRIEKYVNRLVRDTVASMKRNIPLDGSKGEISSVSHSVFDALKFRADFIEDVEIRKAYSLGVILALRDASHGMAYISGNEECGTCAPFITAIDPDQISISDLPPFHASCGCKITKSPPVDFVAKDLVGVEGTEQTTEAENMLIKSGQAAHCPTCKRMALRTSNTVDQYMCRHCGKPFKHQVADLADTATLERVLKKRHPDWDETKVNSYAVSLRKK